MLLSRRKLTRVNAFHKAATAPRKSYLGRFKPLNDIQAAWIKSLLSAWGDEFGGKTREEYCLGGVGFWSCLKDEEWSDGRAQKLTDTLKKLHSMGLRGEKLLEATQAIIWPKKSLLEMLTECDKKESNDFIEQAILSILTHDDPVYIVGIDYYTNKKRISEIAKNLTNVAPWLTRKQSEDRARWCLEIFRAKVFLSVRQSMRGTA
ncbi:hypothetical protein P9911_008165 [Klebsiella oxytoca]|uniref:hypothetical protein n=1 Tax=Klebsiella oxytoca TaxID=571 RepID=UPI0022460697|nr:hypothetical protein [Klebsiella oxytoca]EKW3298734.1 hypothetical protein [Klebsiella oxytoca]MCW9548050.1 hypothetical protein [Klebsiella oxytoca]MEC5505812.1 hypothetical protein [Klebsiella oxytoca]